MGGAAGGQSRICVGIICRQSCRKCRQLLSPLSANSMLREKHVETSEVSFKRRCWMALGSGYLSNRGAKTCCDICQLLCEKIWSPAQKQDTRQKREKKKTVAGIQTLFFFLFFSPSKLHLLFEIAYCSILYVCDETVLLHHDTVPQTLRRWSLWNVNIDGEILPKSVACLNVLFLPSLSASCNDHNSRSCKLKVDVDARNVSCQTKEHDCINV